MAFSRLMPHTEVTGMVFFIVTLLHQVPSSHSPPCSLVLFLVPQDPVASWCLEPSSALSKCYPSITCIHSHPWRDLITPPPLKRWALGLQGHPFIWWHGCRRWGGCRLNWSYLPQRNPLPPPYISIILSKLLISSSPRLVVISVPCGAGQGGFHHPVGDSPATSLTSLRGSQGQRWRSNWQILVAP